MNIGISTTFEVFRIKSLGIQCYQKLIVIFMIVDVNLKAQHMGQIERQI